MTVLTLSAEAVSSLLLSRYGLRARHVELLDAEEATVCRVSVPGRVLAVRVMGGDVAVNQWHGEVLAALGGSGLPVPVLVRDLSGSVTSMAGPDVQMQVTSWLPGLPLASLPAVSLRDLLLDVGRMAARLSAALAAVPAPHYPVTHIWELSQSASSIRTALASVSDRRTVALAGAALTRFAAEVEPFAGDLPRAVVHHDLHDSNLLTSVDTAGRGYLSGILDFGDTVYGLRVAELAVAAAYAARPFPDPVDAFLAVVSGWSSAGAALTDAECAVLYPAAVARLAVNAAVWASRFGGPRDDYARARASGSLDALERMLAIPTAEVTATIGGIAGRARGPAPGRVGGRDPEQAVPSRRIRG